MNLWMIIKASEIEIQLFNLHGLPYTVYVLYLPTTNLLILLGLC